MNGNLYWYRAKVLSVYDGDTCRVSIDVGFGAQITNKSVRLFGINSPEVRGETRQEGLKARDWLRDKIEGKDVMMHTHKDRTGKYGRYLAEIYIDGENINHALVAGGFAEKY